jgi:hypothetical protein
VPVAVSGQASPDAIAKRKRLSPGVRPIARWRTCRFGEAIGRQIAALAISGTGSGQPLGLITALAAKGAVGTGSGGFFGLTAATSEPLAARYSVISARPWYTALLGTRRSCGFKSAMPIILPSATSAIIAWIFGATTCVPL